MERNFSRLIWAPRIILIAYILFLMFFSFDVFGMDGGALERIAGFLIHSAPSIAMVVVLGILWNRPFILGWIFIGAAAVMTVWFGTYVRMESFLMISLPPLAAGIIFLFVKRKGGERAD